MRNSRSQLIIAGILLLVHAVAFAANAPSLMNYQGWLTDAEGTPVTGTYSIVFTIYDDPVAGNVKWQESQSGVVVTDGSFNVMLGSITALTETAFSSQDRWLGIKVGADPEMTPRTHLVTVPYAHRVSTIDGSTGGTVTGNISLEASTETTGNILKGGVLFIHNFGSDNTFIGVNAGNLTMSGGNNTANGYHALQNNTTGFHNTAVGHNVLGSNTTGSNNTASGIAALYSNTKGSGNTASGSGALAYNDSGSYNTANGFSALYNNTGGLYNTASGSSALTNNTTGNNNTATGAQTLQLNTAGSNNTASGFHALEYNTGSNNTATGYNALMNNTGSNNTASGAGALDNNFTGSNNTAIGYGSDVSAGNLTNATAVGYDAIVNASNKIRLGNSDITVIEGQVAYTFTSDRDKKENFLPVDGNEVLGKIRGLNLTSWNYRGQDPQRFRHYGPVAQEFFAAFGHDGVGVSGTPTTINSGDEAGILMIAVQALEKEKERMKAENAELRAAVTALQAQMAALRQELGR